ncbi:M50 family metallopeptidase [Thermosyntropha sp.]|uniref:M50 family metallopeptidase n=1 Tax=Thermosyntropha sp. TaxID=2740820 RepID=UPI0025EEC909|nr:M50 family metallopeptidase [Thermosyntropha sp.]MBO8158777.1 M50 family metallopeptidase [Thermosyntropha sp.]
MRIGNIGGIKLKVNFLVLILSLVCILLGMGIEILIIIAAVIIHELGHIFVSKTMHVKILEIELFPFGGQAQLEDFTGLEPLKELYVALAGPVASLITAAVFYFYSLPEESLAYFIKVNFILGIFNLFPCLPLDGGRILRAFLSTSNGYRKATSNAAFLGQLFSVFLASYGGYKLFIYDFSGINYILAGVFLFWGARRESKLLNYAFMRFLVNKKKELNGKGFLKSRQLVSYADTKIKDILSTLRPQEYTLVVIVDENHHVQGMYGEAELIECMLTRGPNATLKDL